MKKDKGTTVIGYLNKHGQVNLEFDNPNGTDNKQAVYALKCTREDSDGNLCGHVYGANGSDIWQRRCPKCSGPKVR